MQSSSCWFKLLVSKLYQLHTLPSNIYSAIAIDAISWKYFLIFVICDMIFIVLFYLFFPETKNKTLEELEAIFGEQSCGNIGGGR